MKLQINKYALQELTGGKYLDVMTVQEAQKALGIGRVSMYQLIETNQIKAFRIGRVYKVPKRSLIEFCETRGEVL